MARHIDVDEARADAFGLAEELAPFASEPHAHRKHQLLYASEGSLRLRTDEREWLLPPQRAALLPAGVPHAVSATRPVSLRTVYLAPRFLSAPPASAVVFAVTPLARELVLHAMRWTADVPLDARGERFFAAVGALCEEWLEAPLPFSLPVARTPELQAAMEHVLANVGGRVTPAAAARAAGLSVRTLARRFEDEAQLGFRQFVLTARMLRAMELLARPGARIAQVGQLVGFQGEAAFTRAFHAFTGVRPSAFRAARSGS